MNYNRFCRKQLILPGFPPIFDSPIKETSSMTTKNDSMSSGMSSGKMLIEIAALVEFSLIINDESLGIKSKPGDAWELAGRFSALAVLK